MYEVEMKVHAGHDGVRDALASAGATRTAVVYQADTYYDAPARSFAETDEALRVRREAELPADAPRGVESVADALDDGKFDSRVTYKGPRVDEVSKTRRELETGVDDGETMGDVFEALGYDAAATARKRRERWTLDGLTVTLDDVAGLGEFVECETEIASETKTATETETADELDAARERVAGVLRDLDLDPDEQIRTSYLGLLLADEAE